VIRTVDLVIAGAGEKALVPTIAALRRGKRVLVVLSGDARAGQRLRQALLDGWSGDDGQVTVVANAEVVCVDGVDRVEAIVVRHARTGRLSAVNASAFLSCDGRNDEDEVPFE
jgi:predicted dinucleotide-utilizing enzyme